MPDSRHRDFVRYLCRTSVSNQELLGFVRGWDEGAALIHSLPSTQIPQEDYASALVALLESRGLVTIFLLAYRPERPRWDAAWRQIASAWDVPLSPPPPVHEASEPSARGRGRRYFGLPLLMAAAALCAAGLAQWVMPGRCPAEGRFACSVHTGAKVMAMRNCELKRTDRGLALTFSADGDPGVLDNYSVELGSQGDRYVGRVINNFDPNLNVGASTSSSTSTMSLQATEDCGLVGRWDFPGVGDYVFRAERDRYAP